MDFAYQPSTIAISVGDPVSWTNHDSAPHAVSFDTIPVASPILVQGGVFAHTFTAPGTFAYHCQLHPAMRATVTVTNPDLSRRAWLPFAQN